MKLSEFKTLHLENKHTDCLAPELCKVPVKTASQAGVSSCCGSSGCC